MTKEKYNTIIDAMYYKDINDDKGETVKTIPVYRDELDKETKDALFHEIQMEQAELDNMPFEQSFVIMYEALALFEGVEFEDLEEHDFLEAHGEIASVYYNDQLGYLNTGNMYAIADLIRDYECGDVASACVIWYDSTVRDWANTIKNYITSH